MGLLQFKKTESLDAFAKLLATENLTIITNPNARTASFRLASRTLVLPSWEEFQNEHVRELFRAHECAHALYTPPAGWHDAIAEKYAEEPLFAGVLNILEDARIENALKRRYPGFKMVFPRGYWHLYVNGFFGQKPVNKLNFADRINIHTKLRQHSSAQFSPEEQKLVDKIDGITSWPEVVNLAHEVLKLLKEDLKRRKEEREKAKAEAEVQKKKQGCKGEDAKGQNGKQKGKRSKKEQEQKRPGDEDYDENQKLDYEESEGDPEENDPEEEAEHDPTKMPTGEPQDPDPDAEGESEGSNPTDEADEDEKKSKKSKGEGDANSDDDNAGNNESGEPEKGEGDGEKEADDKPGSESGEGEKDQKAGKKGDGKKEKASDQDQLSTGQDDGVNENRDPYKAQDGARPSGDVEKEEDLRTETDEQYRNQLKKLSEDKKLKQVSLTVVSIFEPKAETIRDHMITMEKLQKNVQRTTPTDFGAFMGLLGDLDD